MTLKVTAAIHWQAFSSGFAARAFIAGQSRRTPLCPSPTCRARLVCNKHIPAGLDTSPLSRSIPPIRAFGRVAQRESTAFTWQGSQVQSLSRPPISPVTQTETSPGAARAPGLVCDKGPRLPHLVGHGGNPSWNSISASSPAC